MPAGAHETKLAEPLRKGGVLRTRPILNGTCGDAVVTQPIPLFFEVVVVVLNRGGVAHQRIRLHVGKESGCADDGKEGHEHGEVGQHQGKSVRRQGISTGLEHEVHRQGDEERLEHGLELNEPKGHNGQDGANVHNGGQGAVELTLLKRTILHARPWGWRFQ